jgi:cytochrome c556
MKPFKLFVASGRGAVTGGSAARAAGKFAVAAAALVATAALIDVSRAQPPGGAGPQPTMPLKELMETTITEASNAIWNAYDPPTSAEQWGVLEKAALLLIDAAKTTAVGGTGPKDNEWAKEPAWKPFNDAMLAASEAALEAVRAKDHAALLAASDALYPPCEGCHLQFNPGVVNPN